MTANQLHDFMAGWTVYMVIFVVARLGKFIVDLFKPANNDMD